ncbi:MAG: glycosyl hydrolase 115 family protein [Bacteroidales bacterium]|nr:glycosyl hydrolase 115 family protein [Bacteroidales bacterium]
MENLSVKVNWIMKSISFITSNAKSNFRYLKLNRLSDLFKLMVLMVIIVTCGSPVFAVGNPSYISITKSDGYFPLVTEGQAATIFASNGDYPGVVRVVKELQKDLTSVTGNSPALFFDEKPKTENVIIIGTLGKNPLIDKLFKKKKLNVSEVEGKWETFLIQTIENPMPGVKMALVIVGSDKRGTIYGIYDLCEQIGVSPWNWWADVPVKKQNNLYILPGKHSLGEPAVKYRGIFINDEAPALSGWTAEKFGGFNHLFYEKVFDLILRLKGNYLWPAMWGSAFYDDDTLNPVRADEYGIVIGTSHHEPLMRAHAEWRKYGSGPWNYEKNKEKLQEFWRIGIERMGTNESLVTVGMRGDGDEPMTEGTAISLLENIVKDQREIIEEATGKKNEDVPQVWALYKEVQDYYDKGMRVPEDVTLLWCDDNWGNVRRLPKKDDPPRSGGYGMYYHYDFVGGPRNYKWLNTTQIERVWEQMNLSYQYGVDRIWIVNVGDIKPMELPISFFLDFAWAPEKWPAERLPEYYNLWAEQQFGKQFSEKIAHILAMYTKYNSRRKPEMLAPDTYSLINYREAETVVNDYNNLAREAETIFNELPDEYKDAYYQLVLFPVKACANLNELYVTTAKNYLYAKQQRASTNLMAQKVKDLYEKDAELTEYYHKNMSDGKWNHMMSQIHIGYTYWQQPQKSKMPDVKEIIISDKPAMGIAIEGSEKWWPNDTGEAVLPAFDPFGTDHYIDIFNQGKNSFTYTLQTNANWLKVSADSAEIDKQKRLWVSADWSKVPEGDSKVSITITGSEGTKVIVYANVFNFLSRIPENFEGFIESNGVISTEAVHYSKKVNSNDAHWEQIPNLGRTLSAMTLFPVNAKSQLPEENGPHLEYNMFVTNPGSVKVNVYLSPTQNFHDTQGLRYAVSFDDETPVLVNIHEYDTIPDWKYPEEWNIAVGENIKIKSSEHTLSSAGVHTLKFRMVDPGFVLQKIVVETGEPKYSYLGPPESYYLKRKN